MPSSSTPSSDAIATATDLLGPWFRSLARSVQTGVVLLDSTGKPIFFNEAAHELLGLWTSNESEAMEKLRKSIPASLHEACPDTAELEVELPPPSGKRRVLLRSVSLEDEGCGSLVLVEDRTRRAALDASLVLASRVRAERVLRSQVHDLKAPLNALALHLELLRTSLEQEEVKDDVVREQQMGTMEVLRREIERLDRSLEFFLRYTTPMPRSKGGPRRMEARRPVRETARLVRDVARNAGVRLRTEFPKASTYMIADRDLLKQALLNLVLNALEAQPEGGEIVLGVQRGKDGVRIRVADQGPGIPEHLLDKVFEMNFTTKEDGTGIGLTVARSLVEAQGGRLFLDSRPGRGTAVEILLPAARG